MNSRVQFLIHYIVHYYFIYSEWGIGEVDPDGAMSFSAYMSFIKDTR